MEIHVRVNKLSVSILVLILFHRYLVAGSITILWALIVLAVLPDSPASSHRWFTEEERFILVTRMRGNVVGADVRKVKWYQVREAFQDVKIWLMGAMGAAIYVCNGGVTAFGSLIIKVRACLSYALPYSQLLLVFWIFKLESHSPPSARRGQHLRGYIYFWIPRGKRLCPYYYDC